MLEIQNLYILIAGNTEFIYRNAGNREILYKNLIINYIITFAGNTVFNIGNTVAGNTV